MTPLWSTETKNLGATRVTFQRDGNLVIYADEKILWSTGTQGYVKDVLILNDFGRLLINDWDGTLLWESQRMTADEKRLKNNTSVHKSPNKPATFSRKERFVLKMYSYFNGEKILISVLFY